MVFYVVVFYVDGNEMMKYFATSKEANTFRREHGGHVEVEYC